MDGFLKGQQLKPPDERGVCLFFYSPAPLILPPEKWEPSRTTIVRVGEEQEGDEDVPSCILRVNCPYFVWDSVV